MKEKHRSLEIGQVIGDRWVILEFVASGGMGEVYRAHQTLLKRDVAIKVISKEWLASTTDNEYELETGLKRFRNEVQAMARVRHPNVLQIYDYGSIDTYEEDRKETLEFIAMEYVPGGTLRDTMSDDGFDSEEDLIKEWMTKYFFAVLEGVKAIHALAMVHRDLKPGNVLMDGEMPKICDFGLAHSHEWKPVTQSIDIKGTPAYMSPEHFFDFGRADHRADIYSLGKMLFEAIEGRISPKKPPFKQASLSDPATPFLQALDAVVRTATDEDKGKRFASVEQMKNALEKAIKSIDRSEETGLDPERTRTVWTRPLAIWIGIALAVLSMAAMAVWHLVGLPETTPQRPPRIAMQESEKSGNTAFEAESVKQTILGRDGIRMHLIEGMMPQSRENSAEREMVPKGSFYIDEHQVYNFNFVEFLNEVKPEIIVENGMVKKGDKIWLYMGDERASYEGIIHRHNRFHLKDPSYADKPVVRVTWYGANAYAAHYGKRLPTVGEWQYFDSLKNKENQTPSGANGAPDNHVDLHATHMADEQSTQNMPMEQMMGESQNAPNDRLNFIGAWAVRTEPSPSLEGEPQYPSVVVPLTDGGGSETADMRYPWEGFPNVIFRCVISIP